MFPFERKCTWFKRKNNKDITYAKYIYIYIYIYFFNIYLDSVVLSSENKTYVTKSEIKVTF